MDDWLRRAACFGSRLRLDPHAAHARGPLSDDVANHLDSPVGIPDLRKGLHGVLEKSFPRGRRGLGIPVVLVFSPADDGAPVEAARDDKGPRPVRILSGDCLVEGVGNQTDLPWEDDRVLSRLPQEG